MSSGIFDDAVRSSDYVVSKVLFLNNELEGIWKQDIRV